jgi:hypothetical protein
MILDDIEQAGTAGLDDECAQWDWVRTAGVSAAELRALLQQAIPPLRSARRCVAPHCPSHPSQFERPVRLVPEETLSE